MSKKIQSFLLYILVFAIVIILSYLFISPSYYLYNYLFHEGGSHWGFNGTGIIALLLNYTFFVPLLFFPLASHNPYRLISILLIPIILTEIGSGFAHLWLFLLFGFSGWLLGWGILKVWNLFVKKKS